MHILFLTDNFPPEVNAPASRTYEHAREWVKAGCDVTVITCAPNFPKGKVYEGYRNGLYKTQIIDGIKVIRVWTYITANEGFLRRTLDYLSFAMSATIAAALVKRPDIIVGTSPQFFTALAACLVGLIKWRPWIFEVRDLWPESIKAVGAIQNKTILRLLEGMEMFLYRRAKRIIVVTYAFKDILVARGVDTEKIFVVLNGADLSRFAPKPKPQELSRKLRLSGTFVAGYVGTHGMAHGLDTILEAADILRQRPDASNIRILLLGDGARKAALVERSRRLELENVIFIDSVSKDEVANYWALLDVSVIHLKREPLFKTVIPSKLFECMAMGLPVLHGVEGESADIVRREAVGETFTPEDAPSLAAAIMRLSADRALLGRFRENAIAAAGRYDRTELASRMLEIMQAACVTRPPMQP
jgi:glycosyltransferase involved in cell wall biosynthesis